MTSDPHESTVAATAADPTPAAGAGATWLNGHAWRDGETPPDAASAILHDRGFVLGDGIFETMLVREKEPVLWRLHVDRLLATAGALHFILPGTLEHQVREALETLLSKASPATGQRGTLRITATRGSGTAYGLAAAGDPRPTLAVRLTPAPARSRHLADRETAWIVDQPRIDPSSVLSGHKTTSSMWRVLAHETARKQGADIAVLKTLDGDVAEADTASLFAVIDGVTVTPPLDRGILPSTTREFCLGALRADGRACRERRLVPADLEPASEVFLTSSVSGIRPLGALQGRSLPAPAPVCDWLHGRYETLP